MPSAELLKLLRCPETHQTLSVATNEQVKAWNEGIAAKKIINRAGKVIDQPMESALVRADGLFAYAIRNNIPIMLIDESFPLT